MQPALARHRTRAWMAHASAIRFGYALHMLGFWGLSVEQCALSHEKQYARQWVGSYDKSCLMCTGACYHLHAPILATLSLCARRFEEDQTFSSLQGTTLETMSVVDGTWYVYLKGDYAGRVSGAVYDMRNSSDPVKLLTTVSAGD